MLHNNENNRCSTDNTEQNRSQNVLKHDGIHSQESPSLPLMNMPIKNTVEVLQRNSVHWELPENFLISIDWEKRLEEHLHMSALTGKPLKGLLSFAPMLHAKSKCCTNNNSDDFCNIGKEKDQHLIRLKESILINHFKPSLNSKEDNAELVLFTQ